MVGTRVFQRIVCHEQRVLSLNPQIAFSSQADDLFGASRNSNLIGLPWSPPGLGGFHVGHSIREDELLFPVSVATPIRSNSLSFVHTVEDSRSTLAHSSNSRSVTDCVRFLFPNRKSKASLGFAAGSCHNAAFSSLRCHYRSPPSSIFVGYESARPSSLELVTSACRSHRSENRRRFPRGARHRGRERQFIPTIFRA